MRSRCKVVDSSGSDGRNGSAELGFVAGMCDLGRAVWATLEWDAVDVVEVVDSGML